MAKRPTWATVVGVIGIIFAAFSIIGALQTMVMPYIFDMEKNIMQTVQKDFEKQAEKDAANDKELSPSRKHKHERDADMLKQQQQMMDMMGKYMEVPDWFRTTSLVFGIIGSLAGGFYLLSSIFLLLMKPYAPRMFIWSTGVVVALALAKAAAAIATGSFMAIMMILYSIVGVVVAVVLLIVTATSDKSAFEAEHVDPQA